jgi:hypothetical protein
MVSKRMKKDNKDSFWITNISNRDVSLADLNLTVRAYTSVNLLDSKHYYFTRAQLEKSSESGSLFKKRTIIAVRKVPPEIEKPHRITAAEDSIKSKKRSNVEVIDIKYDELDIPDTVYADENSEIAEADRQPILPKK